MCFQVISRNLLEFGESSQLHIGYLLIYLFNIPFFQGLGTSTSKEGREYFQNLDKHKKDFLWVDEQDGDAIELAFSKKKIEERKNWLRRFEVGCFIKKLCL